MGGIVVLLMAGIGYAWTFTPSYSVYRIRQALETHDYELFTRYVDVDSVLDHALDELTNLESKNSEESTAHGPLAQALRKKRPFKEFAEGARAMAKAGLEFVVEQSVKNRENQLPEIPASALVAALWVGRAEGDTVRFPIKVKKGARVEVKARRTPEGLWRVVEVENLPALLPALKPRSTREKTEPRREEGKESNGEPNES
jgi:hypothetical protein